MLCVRNFLVAKKFFDKSGGECQNFASNYFCLTVTKNSVGEPFRLSLICITVSEIFVRKIFSEKVRMRGRGGAECQNLPSKISCLTVPEIFVRKIFRVSLLSALEKTYASEGYITIFCRNFLYHSAEKIRRLTL